MSEPLTFGSLFAGIGGFDLGFERAGMACRWQVEIDDYANRVLRKHWPDVRRWPDVRTWPQQDTEPVDVICGGFPCQDISYAGRGAGLEGERSGLFFEAVRVVRELRPRAVVLENVAALLTRGLDRVLGTLAEIGYDAEWHCMPAAAVGAPHIRDRVFVMAYAEQPRLERGAWSRMVAASVTPTSGEDVADANKSRMERRTQARNVESGGQNAHKLIVRLSEPCRGEQWATEPNVGRVANGVPARVDRLRGLGNAVVPQVAEYVGRMVLERIEGAAG